jgi:hypothetical protein
MEQPLKVTIPADSFPTQFEMVPEPPLAVKVTVDASEVTVLPPASSTVTTGCWAKAVPPLAVADGWVVKASWCAVPTVTSNGLLVAVKLSAPSVAVRVYVPSVSIEQSLNAATPAVVVAEHPVSDPGPDAIVRAMSLVFVVTVFPPAS